MGCVLGVPFLALRTASVALLKSIWSQRRSTISLTRRRYSGPYKKSAIAGHRHCGDQPAVALESHGHDGGVTRTRHFDIGCWFPQSGMVSRKAAAAMRRRTGRRAGRRITPRKSADPIGRLSSNSTSMAVEARLRQLVDGKRRSRAGRRRKDDRPGWQCQAGLQVPESAAAPPYIFTGPRRPSPTSSSANPRSNADPGGEFR